MGIWKLFSLLGWRKSKPAAEQREVKREKQQPSATEKVNSADLDFSKINITALLGKSPDDIIDRFLKCKNLKVVADSSVTNTMEVVTTPTLSDEEDLVSEELAEIFLAQGYEEEAIAIYRKLSLLNSEKSVYFATLIKKIESK